jgi:hypothetical protein
LISRYSPDPASTWLTGTCPTADRKVKLALSLPKSPQSVQTPCCPSLLTAQPAAANRIRDLGEAARRNTRRAARRVHSLKVLQCFGIDSPVNVAACFAADGRRSPTELGTSCGKAPPPAAYPVSPWQPGRVSRFGNVRSTRRARAERRSRFRMAIGSN